MDNTRGFGPRVEGSSPSGGIIVFILCMKKYFLPIITVCVLAMTFSPFIALAKCPDGIVTCSGTPECPCTWDKVAEMLQKILNFIVFTIAVPLGTLAIIIGAIVLMTSAGNPGRAAMGKTIIWSAIIGLLLALTTRLIINFILDAIGASRFKIPK